MESERCEKRWGSNVAIKAGQIVMYVQSATPSDRFRLGYEGGLQTSPLPAVIVSVTSQSPGRGNIKVFADGPHDLWKTDVRILTWTEVLLAGGEGAIAPGNCYQKDLAV